MNRSFLRNLKRIGLSIVAALILLALCFLVVGGARAASPGDLQFTVEANTDTFFMDHNGWCTGTGAEGPDGMWLPVLVTNNGASTISGLEATFEPPLNTVANDPTRYIGNLASGAAAKLFFFIDYSALRNLPGCTNIPVYSEPYTVTVNSLTGDLTAPAQHTGTFDSMEIQEASAGGDKIAELLGPGAAVGQIVTHAVRYGLTNQSNKPAFFQPTGNAGFLDTCYRLIGAEVTAVTNTTGIAVGTSNTLYFPSVNAGNSSEVEFEYRWQARCTDSGTMTNAWAAQVSGGPWKYGTGNFLSGASFPLPQPVAGVINLSKSSQLPSSFDFSAGTVLVTYTVTFNNTYTQPLLIESIDDVLGAPGAGTSATFASHLNSSDVQPSNSSVSPSNGDSGRLQWFGIPPQTSYEVPANGSIQLQYTALLDYDESNAIPQTFTNTVTASLAGATLGPETAYVTVDPGGVTAVELGAFVASATGDEGWLYLAGALLLLSLLGTFVVVKKPQV